MSSGGRDSGPRGASRSENDASERISKQGPKPEEGVNFRKGSYCHIRFALLQLTDLLTYWPRHNPEGSPRVPALYDVVGSGKIMVAVGIEEEATSGIGTGRLLGILYLSVLSALRGEIECVGPLSSIGIASIPGVAPDFSR